MPCRLREVTSKPCKIREVTWRPGQQGFLQAQWTGKGAVGRQENDGGHPLEKGA